MSSTVIKVNSVSRLVPAEPGTHSGQGWRLAICDAGALLSGLFLCARLIPTSRVSWRFELAELVAIAISMALLGIWGAYRKDFAWSRETPTLIAGTAIGFAVGESLIFSGDGGRQWAIWFLLAWLLAVAALFVIRLTRHFVSAKQLRNAPLSVVVLGKGEDANKLYDALLSDSLRTDNTCAKAWRIAAVFADDVSDCYETSENDMVVGETGWARSFAECCGIKCGIVAVPAECNSEISELVEKSANIFQKIVLAPQIDKRALTVASVRRGTSNLEIQVGNCPAPSERQVAKRILDVAASLALGIVTLPFFCLVAVAIRLTSKGPILYNQLRIGRGNRMFRALKFRTMFVDSPDRLAHYLERDPALRAEWESVHKLKDDPRVTPVGRFLRRFSLDELPQIWNVLVGDMSLVGPRPIVVSEIERYGLDYAAYEAVRPGLTGLWQVSGRNDTTYQQRVDFDSYYVRNWTLRLDAQILVRTFRAVISGVGAY